MTGPASTSRYLPDGRCGRWKPPATILGKWPFWRTRIIKRSSRPYGCAGPKPSQRKSRTCSIPRWRGKLLPAPARQGLSTNRSWQTSKSAPAARSTQSSMVSRHCAPLANTRKQDDRLRNSSSWIYTEHTRTYFLLRAHPSQIETLQPAFEQLIQSARLP